MQDIIDEFNHGDKQKAISMAVHAIDAAPKRADLYGMLATMLLAVKAYDQADALVMKAFGLFGENAELRYTWGLSAYQQGDFKTVLMRLQPLTGPDTAADLRGDANYMIALSYRSLGDQLHALPYALTASELNPKAADAAVLVASLMLSNGAPTQAKTILQPLVDAGNKQVLLTYGMVLAALEDPRASDYLDQAKDATPADYARTRELAQFLGGQAKQKDKGDQDE
ncbi:tetratricopeptide repeat protein [Lacticaseibacillus pabuli]|uniref:Tetratricopeptide repeat protein n=1 Tax=Lacticaseibacillus pabuli TaxID=3025672 RepID=A0ABY7WN67_9LACO|nr:tetratricopeptide repeat protein [Lacticaseibacillus sp. KACC 23028]WDF81648.1 tetratricopeptide repeat protein [Lacticaseibacillus sp. KACC 23028]